MVFLEVNTDPKFMDRTMEKHGNIIRNNPRGYKLHGRYRYDEERKAAVREIMCDVKPMDLPGVVYEELPLLSPPSQGDVPLVKGRKKHPTQPPLIKGEE